MRLLRLVILLVAVAIVVFPAGMALAYPPANPVRVLPATVERGATFNVTVNFTAPADNFTSISLTDFAPAGWNVTVSGAWCQPPATGKATGNMAELSWYLTPYGNGTNFTARYKVPVPCGTELGNYTFGNGFLGYYIGNGTTHIFENITGDFNVTVVPPAICSTPSIDFYAPLGGQNPENQTLQLWSSTPCMIDWSLSDDADYEGHDWLSENSTSGNCTNVHSSVALSVNTSGMPVGNYIANITIEAPEANNSPRIVPVSLHIRTTGTLKGHVNFLGRGDPGTDRWVEPFVVKFFDNATKLEMFWSPINATTDAYGNFTIEVVAGTYDIGIKNRTCLSELNSSVIFTAGNVTWVNFGTIREGDVKESDKVDGSDFALFSGAYNTRPGDTEWNANADLNRSGKVDGSDFALLSSNYNAKGAAYGYF
jgi:hypothetical protein